MILIKTTRDLQELLQKFKSDDLKLGFVPTMGALHQGHLALVGRCISENDICLSSIFVNPTQFNNQGDFEKYPITIEQDINLLEKSGCHILFIPSVQEMYPSGHKTKTYDLGYIETILEGAFRPGHYQGVCQVVDKFLSIVKPNRLYLGQKDYQQCMVITKMVQLEQHPVKIAIVPTEREDSGLAMSSRNMRLTADQRQAAAAISRNLSLVREQLSNLPFAELKRSALTDLAAEGFKVDYFELANKNTLEPIDQFRPGDGALLLVAATLGDVRLIDNLLIGAT